MAELTIIQNGQTRRVPFSGTPRLDEVLQAAEVLTSHPCGGHGRCGKCAVTLTGCVSEPDEAERRYGTRLSCRAVLLGDATVILANNMVSMRIETETEDSYENDVAFDPMAGQLGVAVDIGTTTVAVKAYDLRSGRCVGTASAPNPQIAVAADVMGRIEAALFGQGEHLQSLIYGCLNTLLAQAVPGGERPDALVLTGNTTMLYLLCGRDTVCLSCAPFEADTLFGCDTEIGGIPTYLPPCMNAFVGADITCAVLASGMCNSSKTALLCDIGTNGELALWRSERLFVTSTAAGPAFEGAGISCGCGSIEGAIDRVWVENGTLRIHTIGEAPAVGLCGSGLIDAIAAGLALGCIDEMGGMDAPMVLGDNVVLEPRDVRAVQLAKAAIAAGIETLLEVAGCTADEVETLYIAGGFGSHLSVESAADIGLLPRTLTARTQVLGNAALTGAVLALLNKGQRAVLNDIAAVSLHINLGGDPRFNEHYVDHMLFGEEC